MKITLELPDSVLAGFLNCVRWDTDGLHLVSCQLDSRDFVDGNVIKLPRKDGDG